MSIREIKDKLLAIASVVRATHRTSRKTRIISATALGMTLLTFGAAGVAPLAPDASDLPVTLVVEELALPDLATQIASLSPAQQFVSEERVRSGDSLATLLDRLGVNDAQAASFIKSDPAARALLNLRPGRRVQATVTPDGKLLSASTLLADGDVPQKLVISRFGKTFATVQSDTVLEHRTEMRSGEIRSSLFAATDAAQIPDAVAMQLVDMFSTDIDFSADLRRGDRFNVVYESIWQGGEYVRSGRVLAAEFRNGGKIWQAVWLNHPGSADQGGYYDLNGKSLKKAFLKSPLQFSRVTSGFTMRLHPISGKWKQHKGIDFAAPVGTPIRAVGDGVIDFVGTQGGYGNVLVVQHGSVYSTAYAHLSRMVPGMRRGTRVSQGEVIGYVGTTGWSTGPHLHYEFRVNNDARDPNSIVTPQVQALAGVELQRFRSVAADMSHRFELLSPAGLQVASR